MRTIRKKSRIRAKDILAGRVADDLLSGGRGLDSEGLKPSCRVLIASVPAGDCRAKGNAVRALALFRDCPRNCKRRATAERATGRNVWEGRPELRPAKSGDLPRRSPSSGRGARVRTTVSPAWWHEFAVRGVFAFRTFGRDVATRHRVVLGVGLGCGRRNNRPFRGLAECGGLLCGVGPLRSGGFCVRDIADHRAFGDDCITGFVGAVFRQCRS